MNENSSPYYDPIETAPRSEIARVQQQRLMEQIRHVYAHSPLVKSVWETGGVTPDMIDSVEAFCARVPFIDKDTLRDFRDRNNDPFGGVLCTNLSEVTNIGSSSGTTGDPTLFAERQGHVGEWVMSPRYFLTTIPLNLNASQNGRCVIVPHLCFFLVRHSFTGWKRWRRSNALICAMFFQLFIARSLRKANGKTGVSVHQTGGSPMPLGWQTKNRGKVIHSLM